MVLSDFNPHGAELRFRAQDVDDGMATTLGLSLYDDDNLVAWLTLGDSDLQSTHMCLNSEVSQSNHAGDCLPFLGSDNSDWNTHSRLAPTDWVTVVFSASADAPAMSVYVNGFVAATSSQTGSMYHAESGNSLDVPLQLYSDEWVLELQVSGSSSGCGGYANWQDWESNNHEGNDERNAIMNCCGTDGVESTGRWYDAPDDYGAPKPLCRLQCTGHCVSCDGPGYEDCLECESGYAHYDEDGDGGGSCWHDWWHYYHEEDDDDDGGGFSELVMSGGLVAIGLTFTGITIATIANLLQEQCALGPTIIFEAGTTHPYYITPNLCTIGAHTYSSKKTVRDASPRKVCRKFCEAASSAGKLALKHVQGLTCYCKRR